MLQFFRRYQKFFYIVVTFVIVVTFSFFGVRPASPTPMDRSREVIGKAADDSRIYRGEFQDLLNFIRSDQRDSFNYHGAAGFNFLNDGVVRKDFLETGLMDTLMERHLQLVQEDLRLRFAKEKHFRTYVHPASGLISAESAWEQFSPSLKESYKSLQGLENGSSMEGVQARIRLYLDETAFPASSLRQVLQYQQSQYNWIPDDPNLSFEDLSLFGYHNVEDWFGPQFLSLIAETIWNGSIVAEQLGYKVSDAEVVADLLSNTELSFQQNSRNPRFSFTNAGDYYRNQLRLLRMDQNRVVKTWKRVLLFRRLMENVEKSVFVDALFYRQLQEFATEEKDVVLYELPEELRISGYEHFQNLEVYLDLVTGKKSSSLDLPKEFLSVEEIEKKAPEFVERRYLVELSEVDRSSLQTRVGVRQTWDWEGEEGNWQLIVDQFPELKNADGSSKGSRLEALRGLNARLRARVDAFAREQIVDAHPEWLEQALTEAEVQEIDLRLRTQGVQGQIQGLTDSQELTSLLDAVNLDEGTSEELNRFSPDGRHYYRIRLLEKEEGKQVLTFREALADGTLEKRTLDLLQKHYESIRGSQRATFEATDGTWKPLEEVRNVVADDYFAQVLKLLRTQKARDVASEFPGKQRLFSHVEKVQAQLQEGDLSDVVRVEGVERDGSLAGQWKLVERTVSLQRDRSERWNTAQAWELAEGEWSAVAQGTDGNLSFFQVLEQRKGMGTVARQMSEGQKLLGAQAKRLYFARFVEELEEKVILGALQVQVPVENLEDEEV